MKGGFNNPPNAVDRDPLDAAPVLASMKGGFNNPPNLAAAEVCAATARLQ